MKLSSFRLLRLCPLLLILPAVVRSAEDPKKPDDQTRNQWIFNVDFPGGSLEQLVKSVSTADGAIFNVVGEKTDLAVTVPAFSLRNADGESLANALNQLIAPRGLNITRAQGPNIVAPGSRVQTNYPIYVLVRRSAIERAAFDSFQLAPYLEKQSIDDIVMAIRTLWELNPGNKPEALLLKFHPPTKLLLVSGTPEAIGVAGKVISTLGASPGGPGTVVTHSTLTDEQRRLEAAAAEAARRRGSAKTPKEENPPKQ